MTAHLARVPFLLGVVFVALAVVVLMTSSAAAPPAFEGMDLVVCLDVSRSMLARDVAPDRLARAKAEIALLAEAAGGDRLGLVLFAGEAWLLVPRTQDGASLAEMAALTGPWDVTRGGTDLPAALSTAHDALRGRGGPGAIVVLSDGEDLGGREVDSVLAALRADGVAVHALGLGTTRGAKIPDAGAFVRGPDGLEVISRHDPRTLARIADATGGAFAHGGSSTLPALFASQILPDARAAQARAVRAGLGDSATWLLALGALLLLFDIGVGRVRVAPALALLVLGGGVLSGCGPSSAPDRDAYDTFLRGNAAFADSLALEAAAEEAPESERGDLFRAAYRRAEDALASWQWAAATRLDWPEARRNVERGLLRMRALRERGTEGGKPKPKVVPDPKKDEEKKDDETKKPDDPKPPKDPPVRVDARELPEGRILGILETLRVREKQKIELRKARRTVRPPLGGRDW